MRPLVVLSVAGLLSLPLLPAHAAKGAGHSKSPKCVPTATAKCPKKHK
jgi:hypothetical protein